MNNVAKEKARQLRYKKAALARLNLDTIRDELSEISENCDTGGLHGKQRIVFGGVKKSLGREMHGHGKAKRHGRKNRARHTDGK